MTMRDLPSIPNVECPLRRSARAATRAASLRLAGALCASLLLSACGTVEWVKTRFVEPNASAPAPSAHDATPKAEAPAVAPAPPPASQRAPLPPASRPITESTPQQTTKLAPPAQVAAAPAQPAPVAAPAAPPTARAAQPRAARAAAAPAPRVALAAPAASGDLAPGRWAVQVGVFFVANSAEAVRARVAAQLAQSDIPADSRATRVVRRDKRYFVVVGDAADQGAAQALAGQVRAALKQDVVLFRR